jgi:N-acetylglucosaminyldiphosphoundecaprenol N-acetyl-beta-D-mannosaminyltransferase
MVATSIRIRAPQPLVRQRDRVNLLGTEVDRIEWADVAPWLEHFILSGQPHQIITANLDFIAIARRRPDFARVIAGADLVVCDGKPLQWASQLQGEAIPARVTGMDLVLNAAKLSAELGYSLYFMGGAPGVAARAADALQTLMPGVVMAGTDSPRVGQFDDAEDARIIARIRAARPDVLFVALGAPRQDEWIASHLAELGVPLCAGIGGVFNFLAGETKRAPEWMQQAGLEWAFRLYQEPSRLWKRYLVDDLPIFCQLLARQVNAHLFGGESARPAPHPAPGTLAELAPARRAAPAPRPIALRPVRQAPRSAHKRRAAQPRVRSLSVRRPVARAAKRG